MSFWAVGLVATVGIYVFGWSALRRLGLLRFGWALTGWVRGLEFGEHRHWRTVLRALSAVNLVLGLVSAAVILAGPV